MVKKKKKRVRKFKDKVTYIQKIKRSNSFVKKYIRKIACKDCTKTTWCAKHGYLEFDTSKVFKLKKTKKP